MKKKQIVDADTPCTDYIVVSDDTTAFLSNKTYVVNSDVKISSQITAYKNVNLILCDGFTLTALKGINLTGSLNIYGQINDTGKLIATGADYSAGIGGSKNNRTSGTLTINGGTIVAKGGLYSAGIGGGDGGAGGNVAINGGIIEAIGGSAGAGIGGSFEGRGGNVIINGGIVNATGGGSNSSGIGKGNYAQSSEEGVLILGKNIKLEISTNGMDWINSDTVETRTTYMKTSTINIEPTKNESDTSINYIDRIKELEEENTKLKEENEKLRNGLNIPTTNYGDINGDNVIDGRDATLLLTYYAKTSTGYEGTLAEFVASSEESVNTNNT